ncbi:glycerate dehydrogenase [Sesbania bispinosa]|nr:glycerate dehydrogenase [Sesbania bispinosa]
MDEGVKIEDMKHLSRHGDEARGDEWTNSSPDTVGTTPVIARTAQTDKTVPDGVVGA